MTVVFATCTVKICAAGMVVVLINDYDMTSKHFTHCYFCLLGMAEQMDTHGSDFEI